MKKVLFLMSIVFFMCLFFVTKSFAEKLTLELVKTKATSAANLIKAEGIAAFEKIKDPKGEFRFGDGEGYCWVQKQDGTILMHPVKPGMDNNNYLDIKDVNGKLFNVGLIEIVKKYGAGWVTYQWQKPNSKEFSPKATYIISAGGDLMVGSGMYDATEKDIKAKFPNDPIWEEK